MTEVRLLEPDDVERVLAAGLGLARLPLQGDDLYLVAWDGDDPVGHAHLKVADPPEVGDIEVLPQHRRRGIGTALVRAAEGAAAARGYDRLQLTVSVREDGPQALYRRLGFVDADVPPRRVQGTIQIRSGPLEVDDTLLTWEKRLGVDSAPPRSS
jgi:ribosomal protein S18 acetylase RimI-like enzyme